MLLINVTHTQTAVVLIQEISKHSHTHTHTHTHTHKFTHKLIDQTNHILLVTVILCILLLQITLPILPVITVITGNCEL
jgi:hypothetical protein